MPSSAAQKINTFHMLALGELLICRTIGSLSTENFKVVNGFPHKRPFVGEIHSLSLAGEKTSLFCTLCIVVKLHSGRRIPCICNVTHLTYFPLSAFETDRLSPSYPLSERRALGTALNSLHHVPNPHRPV